MKPSMNKTPLAISMALALSTLIGCTNENVDRSVEADKENIREISADQSASKDEGWKEYWSDLQEKKALDRENDAICAASDVFGKAHEKSHYDITEMNIQKNPVGDGYFFWKEPITHARSNRCKLWCWMVVDDTVFHLSLESQTGVNAYWPNEVPEKWAATNLPEDFRIDGEHTVGETRRIIESLE